MGRWVWLGPEDLARHVDGGRPGLERPQREATLLLAPGRELATPPTPTASAPLPRGCCVGRRDPGAHPPGSAARTTARGCSSRRVMPTPRCIPVLASRSCGTGRTRSWCVPGLGDPRGAKRGSGRAGALCGLWAAERLVAERGSGGPPCERTPWPRVVGWPWPFPEALLVLSAARAPPRPLPPADPSSPATADTRAGRLLRLTWLPRGLAVLPLHGLLTCPPSPDSWSWTVCSGTTRAASAVTTTACRPTLSSSPMVRASPGLGGWAVGRLPARPR